MVEKDPKFRKELLMDINDFQKPAYRSNLEALAQTIQNIILIDPGTYPNDPNFGCGISYYLFEFNDSVTITELQSKIDEQITKYALHPDVTVSTNVSSSRAMNGRMSILTIDVSIYETSSNKATGEKEAVSFSYMFAGNTETKTIVSRIMN